MVTEPMTEEQKQACMSIFHTHGIVTNFSYYDGLQVKDGFIDEPELYTAILDKDSSLSNSITSAIVSNILANFDTNNDRKISLAEMSEYSKNIRPINPQVSQQVINQFVQTMNLIKQYSYSFGRVSVNSFATSSKEEFLNLVSQSTAIGERTGLMVCIYLPYQCQDGSWLVVYHGNDRGYASTKFFSPYGKNKAERQVQELLCDFPASSLGLSHLTIPTNLIVNNDIEGSQVYLSFLADLFLNFNGLRSFPIRMVGNDTDIIRREITSWSDIEHPKVNDFQIYRQAQLHRTYQYQQQGN